MVILWITDRWECLEHPKDTSLRLMQECLISGFETYWSDPGGIHFLDGMVFVQAKHLIRVEPGRDRDSFLFDDAAMYPLSQFGSIHVRIDPPVNETYFSIVNLLSLGIRLSWERGLYSADNILVNPAEVLLFVNSKLEGFCLGEYSPQSVITSDAAVALKFGRKMGVCVVKPINASTCRGVYALSWESDEDIRISMQRFEEVTDGFNKPMVLQEKLDVNAGGEIRCWFVDGHLIGYARKVGDQGRWPVDVDNGARVVSTILSTAEKALAEHLGRHLARRHVRLAAIDIVNNRVIDFNVISPGLLCEMEYVTGENLAKKVIDHLYCR